MQLFLASEGSNSFNKIKPYLTGRRTAVYIPTAAYAENYDPTRDQNTAMIEAAGFQVTLYNIADSNEADTTAALTNADIIYIGGGNTFYLLQEMRKCNFEAIIRERLATGTIMIGSSAGSVVCSPDIGFIAPMDDPSKSTLSNYTGLDILPFSLLPHLDHLRHGKAAAEIIRTYASPTPLIALNDDQVIYVKDSTIQLL